MGIISNGGRIAVGTVGLFPLAAAPAGWLKANGAAVSRWTYYSLFLAIGTTFGAGDGSTTFNLPDFRGEFLRGLDDGRGVDSGRVLGSAQSGQNASHTHGIHGSLAHPGSWTPNFLLPFPDPGAHQAADSEGNVASSGGNEARPRNIALLACIKF